MSPKVAELIAALPDLDEDLEASPGQERLPEILLALSQRPVPVGAARRLWALGGLQAHLSLAYLAYWVRSWFLGADERVRELSEAHLRAALKMLTTMGYLRGAVMKLGQALANYPDVVPSQIVTTLERLHFDAPPMHFALLRELIENELGCDPEERFASFETDAFAAASLGQVHRAVLESGQEVAVKVQYPGIGASIRSDFRSLSGLLLPLRLTKAWESMKGQFEDVCRVVERETDYEQEAASLRVARSLFREDDGIIVPRVYDEFSTRRVLTMEYLDGIHLYDFLADDPPQELRDHFGTKVYLAGCRLYYAGKLLYADPHPGNYLFLDDDRLGFIDLGCVRPYTSEEWACCRRLDAAVHGGRAEMVRAAREITGLSEGEELGSDHFGLIEDWCQWIWRPYHHEGPFDFGDESYLREGVSILFNLLGKRYTRGIPMTTLTARWYFGTVAVLLRLRARVDVKTIYERERAATGWSAPARRGALE